MSGEEACKSMSTLPERGWGEAGETLNRKGWWHKMPVKGLKRIINVMSWGRESKIKRDFGDLIYFCRTTLVTSTGHFHPHERHPSSPKSQSSQENVEQNDPVNPAPQG